MSRFESPATTEVLPMPPLFAGMVVVELSPDESPPKAADVAISELPALHDVNLDVVPAEPSAPDRLTLRSRLLQSPLGRAALGLGMATGLVTGGLALEAAPAAAATTSSVHHVYNTSGDGLWLHPDSPTKHSKLSDWMQDGTEFDITCWKYGDDVEGDAVWDEGTNVTTGHTGVAADKYIDTDTTLGNEGPQLTAQGVSECGSTANNSGAESQRTPPSGEYNRQAAADWALAHAEDPQVYNTDECTWFASQVLWAGGIPKTSAWTDQGTHGHLHPVPGTVDAWVPGSLKDYLLARYPESTYTELNFGQNSQPNAKPGDVIFYDWETDGMLDHTTIVVDDAPGTQYPEIAEWGNVDDKGQSSNSQKQGWTWSAVGDKWIQAVYPNPSAYLLHINTGLEGVPVMGDPSLGNVG